MAKDNTIYDLVLCVGPIKSRIKGLYLIPDFKDAIEEYIATPRNSEERKQFVQKRNDINSAVRKVFSYLIICYFIFRIRWPTSSSQCKYLIGESLKLTQSRSTPPQLAKSVTKGRLHYALDASSSNFTLVCLSIRKKLSELGYSEDVIEFCHSMDHIASRRLTAIMRQPRRLTDRSTCSCYCAD